MNPCIFVLEDQADRCNGGKLRGFPFLSIRRFPLSGVFSFRNATLSIFAQQSTGAIPTLSLSLYLTSSAMKACSAFLLSNLSINDPPNANLLGNFFDDKSTLMLLAKATFSTSPLLLL